MLASNSGTILDAILAQRLPVALVVVDRVCGAEDIAASHGVRCRRVERRSFGAGFDRDAYTAELTQVLLDDGIELIAMAGFGTILGQPIYDHYADRVLNTHPALLPAFKGWHAVADALAAGAEVTGCTVHVATLEVDDGPILAQEAVTVLPDDDEASLHERIKAVERRLYPDTIRKILERGSVA